LVSSGRSKLRSVTCHACVCLSTDVALWGSGWQQCARTTHGVLQEVWCIAQCTM
jgi:hypothetical protein